MAYDLIPGAKPTYTASLTALMKTSYNRKLVRIRDFYIGMVKFDYRLREDADDAPRSGMCPLWQDRAERHLDRAEKCPDLNESARYHLRLATFYTLMMRFDTNLKKEERANGPKT